MNKPEFVYVTYISTTPQKLWSALTEGELTRQYWGGEQSSDWKAGSRWEHRRNGSERKLAILGDVIESDPPRRLVLSWADPKERDRKASYSRVTFDIEPVEGKVRLTVMHEGLEPEMLRNISGGWPLVLSNLKTFLETGKSSGVQGCQSNG